MADLTDWEQRVLEKRRRQAQSIPQEWLIRSKPPEHQTNVLNVPETCGLLTERELEITRTNNVETIVSNIANGIWSSVEVTTAFCKRAIVVHQIVSSHIEYRDLLRLNTDLIYPDKLLD